MRLASLTLAILVATPLAARAERGGDVPAMTGVRRSVDVVPGSEPAPPAVPVPVPVVDPLAGAPRPEDAGGVIVARPRPADRPWLRAALFVPRHAVAALLAPARLALWAEDTYHVSTRSKAIFWNDERTIGLYPTVGWNFGRDVKGGAVFAANDVLGAALRVRATAGTVERYAAAGSVRVDRGPGALELAARRRDAEGEGYFGIGDVDDEVSRYGLEETQVKVGARVWLAEGVAVSLGGSMRWLDFRDTAGILDDPTIGEVHDVATVPGFEDGVEAARGELALFVDRRRPRHRFQSAATPSTGWAAQAFAGWQHDVDGGARFVHGGADVARAIDLFGGDRVLTVRATLDGVVGADGEVPFVDLPSLGGTRLLRGYSTGRFRDRWAATASAEYMYPVTDGAAAFVFTDVGRVAARPEDLADQAPRVGFGMGLQAHTRTSLLARVWLASSSDGGFFASLGVEPVFSARGREVVR